MANEFIGRLGTFGLRRESSSGVESALDLFWVPKISGSLKPDVPKVALPAGMNVIDDIAGSAVEKRGSTLDLECILGDLNIGFLLYAAFGTVVLTKCLTITGAAGGTPAKGNTISSSAGAWSGIIQKVITIGGTTYYFVSTSSGTIGPNVDVTNGTWTGGTSAVIAGVTGHYFTRLNTNNHPAWSLYDYTPNTQYKALYGMMETLDMEFMRGDFGKAKAAFKAKAEASTTGLTPSYGAENFFLGKHFGIKFGTNEAALNAADLVAIEKFSITFAKNLNVAYGSRTTAAAQDVRAIFNQQFGVTGSFDVLYNATTYRDYVTANTNKACRTEWIASDATALATGIYPSLYIDYDKIGFESWSPSDGLDEIVTETIGIVPEYDRSAGSRVDALLINGRSTTY